MSESRSVVFIGSYSCIKPGASIVSCGKTSSTRSPGYTADLPHHSARMGGRGFSSGCWCLGNIMGWDSNTITTHLPPHLAAWQLSCPASDDDNAALCPLCREQCVQLLWPPHTIQEQQGGVSCHQACQLVLQLGQSPSRCHSHAQALQDLDDMPLQLRVAVGGLQHHHGPASKTSGKAIEEKAGQGALACSTCIQYLAEAGRQEGEAEKASISAAAGT